LTPAHRARHNPDESKSVTYVPNEYSEWTSCWCKSICGTQY
jgi:hypothetical protein